MKTYISILLVCSLVSGSMIRVEFVQDFMKQYTLKDPMFIIHLSELDKFLLEFKPLVFEAMYCICYEIGVICISNIHSPPVRQQYPYSPSFPEQDMTEIVENIMNSNVELIVFMGNNHGKLIDILDRDTAVFRLPLVTIMMDDVSDRLDLRLDTNILIIDQNDNTDNYQVKEVYSVKKGPKITRVVGNWSMRARFSLENLNVYERRQNLGGIQLRDALLPYAKITKPYYDQDDYVIRSGGVFQGYI